MSVLASPQLGLVNASPGQKWQRRYCYAHRGFILALLVFTSIIQILVCFRRDGFVANLPLSSTNKTVCNVEQHVIISNLMQECLLIVAYVLLVLYITKWQPEKRDLVSSLLSYTILLFVNTVEVFYIIRIV